MKSCKFSLSMFLTISMFCSHVAAQQGASTQSSAPVPRLVNFTGKAADAQGKPIAGIAGVTLAIYKDQYEGAPLWLETQNVQANAKGTYTVQLRATKPEGLPLDLFSAGEARWLGVRMNGGEEQPRVVLVSVPYALKALDAETLGGRPVSAFMVAPPSGSAGSKGSQQGSLAEQANEIVCLSGTACKTGFVPLFSSNGGSAKVNNSIITQSAGAISVAGRETVTSSASRPALSGRSSGTNAVSDGVDGVTSSGTASGVAGINNGNGIGVYGTGGTGVFGTGGYGVWGEVSSPGVDGVHGVAHTQFSGVAGLNDGSGFGVFGEAFGSAIDGVHGVSNNAAGSGVAGVNFAGGDGVFGGSTGGFAGYFGGDVNVTGNLSKGGGSFKIDHPLDPANKYFYHSFV